MNATSQRTVQPESFRLTVEFNAEDIAAAAGISDPDDLYFQIFSPTWYSKPPAEQLRLAADFAEKVDQARALGLTAGNPVNK